MAKFNWQKALDRSWFLTKVFAILCIMCGVAFTWGTFYPNQTAVKNVNLKLDQFYMQKIKEMDLREPEFTYNNDIQFVRAMHKCINYINFSLPKNSRVPYEMIIGQAALESGWGTSRFATEGNNLFGIRTWTKEEPHLMPLGIKKWPGWGVKVFASKCDSVKEYIRLLNEHPAYKEFREIRANMFKQNKQLDSLVLIKTLDKFSTTADYDKRVTRMIMKIRKMEENNE